MFNLGRYSTHGRTEQILNPIHYMN